VTISGLFSASDDIRAAVVTSAAGAASTCDNKPFDSDASDAVVTGLKFNAIDSMLDGYSPDMFCQLRHRTLYSYGTAVQSCHPTPRHATDDRIDLLQINCKPKKNPRQVEEADLDIVKSTIKTKTCLCRAAA
jgi:hypothetical protein